MKNIDNPSARHYYGASLIADVKQQRQNVGTGGYSSAGRALAWHARGQRFDPAYLHQ